MKQFKIKVPNRLPKGKKLQIIVVTKSVFDQLPIGSQVGLLWELSMQNKKLLQIIIILTFIALKILLFDAFGGM